MTKTWRHDRPDDVVVIKKIIFQNALFLCMPYLTKHFYLVSKHYSQKVLASSSPFMKNSKNTILHKKIYKVTVKCSCNDM